jgi:hypothetical protein
LPEFRAALRQARQAIFEGAVTAVPVAGQRQPDAAEVVVQVVDPGLKGLPRDLAVADVAHEVVRVPDPLQQVGGAQAGKFADDLEVVGRVGPTAPGAAEGLP